MSATYEGMSPGGHETYATSIFSKIKTYLDSNPYTPYKGNLTGTISSNSPAVELQAYWDDNDKIKLQSVNTAYNTSGTEYSFLLSKGGSNRYGTVLRWSYSTKYIEILRKGINWQSTNWEKISAGYADSAGSATSATTASKLGSSNVGSATQPIYLNGGTATACTYTLGKSVPSDAVFTDTKNTAGSTDTSSKIYLIGATSQAANPQTYSQDTAYVGTDGCLYSGGTKVLTAHQDISGKADKSATVSNVSWSNNKLTKTINGTTSDVVSAATILGNLTSSQVTSALGFTPTANTGTITSVKTTAGAHTAINVTSGAANFNVPTKTSHLTNDSGFVTTDANVKQTPITNQTGAYRILFSRSADDTEHTEGVYKFSGLTYDPDPSLPEFIFSKKMSDSEDTESPQMRLRLLDSQGVINEELSITSYDIFNQQGWGGDVTVKSLSTILSRKVNKSDLSWGNISGKPSTFAPSAHDHNYLVSAGTNTQSTSSTAYALGIFNARWFNATGKIPGQPAQYGFLLTTATGTNSVENHQIFVEQPNGNLYHRGTNASTSSSPPAFKTILDSSNYTSYTRNSSGVIKVKSVNKTPTNAGTSLASPTPSIDSGYKFLCWLYVQSNGYIVGASYPGGATATNATWWFANGYLANYALTFYYLEIKDTI